MQEKVKLNNLKIDWTRWVEEDEEDAKPDFGTAPSTHRSVRCADAVRRQDRAGFRLALVE
jgi:hypothetical protein